MAATLCHKTGALSIFEESEASLVILIDCRAFFVAPCWFLCSHINANVCVFALSGASRDGIGESASALHPSTSRIQRRQKPQR